MTIHDSDHSDDEDRYVIMGETDQQRLLVVSFTDREDPFESSARGWRTAARGRSMKKAANRRRDPDIADHYDFSNAERGKYARRFAEGITIVVHKPSQPVRIKCDTLNKTEKSVNCRLTKDQALALAAALREKAEGIENGDGRVHLSNVGRTKTIIVGRRD
jgi:hypothetical protein